MKIQFIQKTKALPGIFSVFWEKSWKNNQKHVTTFSNISFAYFSNNLKEKKGSNKIKKLNAQEYFRIPIAWPLNIFLPRINILSCPTFRHFIIYEERKHVFLT